LLATFFRLLSSLAVSLILKTEATSSFATSGYFQRTTRRYIPEVMSPDIFYSHYKYLLKLKKSSTDPRNSSYGVIRTDQYIIKVDMIDVFVVRKLYREYRILRVVPDPSCAGE
jgi:hypothetical protein